VTATTKVGQLRPRYHPGTVEILVLGPIEVSGPGGRVPLGGPKERTILAALAVQAGDVVSPDRLADALWGDHPPRSAPKLVQNLVLRLRKAIGREVIETIPGGYVLRVGSEGLDAPRFERLVAEGREHAAAEDPTAAVSAFAAACGLWRGQPFLDIADWPGVEATATRLQELHRCAEEELAEASLALGRHRESVARLEALVAGEPLRERRWALLMTALYRCGRQADALRAYQRARTALGELGLEPGPELVAIERAVTAHDPILAPPGGGNGTGTALPTGVVTFLLTSVAGSAALWAQAPEAMGLARQRHDAIIEAAVAAAGGTMLPARGEGDRTFSVFTRTSAAVAAAVAACETLSAEPWPPGACLDVRVAVHTGEAFEQGGDYRGPTVSRAAALRDLARSDRLVLSEAVASLVRDDLPAGWDLAELGEHALPGLTRPERVFALVPSGATLGGDATVVARSCPYMGLLPFEAEDHRLFFGRDDVVTAIVDRLALDRFVAVVGASGSGKSSLLRAGLVARLQRPGDAERQPPWITVVCTPTARPLAELAARVAPACDLDAAALLADLENDPRALDLALRRAAGPGPHGRRVALIVDQLEELYTQCRDDAARRRFLDALVDVAATPDGPASLVVAVRSDFFGHGAEHPGLARLLEAHALLLGPMDEGCVRAAIEGPAGVAGLALDPGLTDLVLRDVAGEPGALPLLSHALAEVWARREAGTLTVAAYREIGGVGGAIARTAEAVFERFDGEHRRVARDVFVRLVELGDGTEDTSRRLTVDELARNDPEQAARVGTVVDALVAARLVTTSDGSVEVAHEALIGQWPRLRGWLDEDREGLRVMQHLADAAHDWDRGGRHDADLYRGPRLVAALEWSAGHGDEGATPLEGEFLARSRGRQDAEVRAVRARNRRLRGLLAGTGVALALALVAGSVAVAQRNRASTARDRAAAAAEAEVVSRLVVQSRLAQEETLDLALLLALEANRRLDTPETRGALQSALMSDDRLLGFLWGADAGRSSSVEFSAAGVLAVGRGEGAVDLWDDDSGPPDATLEAGDGDVAIAFSADGSTLGAVSEGDKTLTLWDVATHRRIGRPLTGLAGRYPPALSADGRLVSAVSASGEIATWAVATGEEHEPRIASPDGERYRVIAASPDGRWLAAGTEGGRVALYDAETHQPVSPTLGSGLDGPIHDLAFDHDGDRLAAVGGIAFQSMVWDLRTGDPVPSGGGLVGYGVAFSPRDDRLVVGDVGGVRVVDLANPGAPPEFVPTKGGTSASVAFSPDGAFVAAGNSNGSVSLVDMVGRRPLGEPLATDLPSVLYSPDGELFAAPDVDGSVALLDADDGSEIRRLTAPDMVPPMLELPVGPGLAFSGDGSYLAFGGMSGRIKVWDVATGAIVQTLTPPPATATRVTFPAASLESYVGPLAFSPDGTKLAVASLETGTIFDLRSGAQIGHPTGWLTLANEAFFTPDGDALVISGFQPQETLLFDPDTGERVGEVIDRAFRAANGPDGTLFVSDQSGAGRLVDVTTGEQVGPPIGHLQLAMIVMRTVPGDTEVLAQYPERGAQLFDVASGQPIGDPFPTGEFTAITVSPDGQHLVIHDGRHLMRWNLDQSTWAGIACEAAGRNLTRAEWDRYLANAGRYRATCPDLPA
jgi:DNA-binding SARP family transcriptional activator/WD40 repeat protein